MPSRRGRVLALRALPAVATLAAFAPALGNGSVRFDDPGFITANARVRAGGAWTASSGPSARSSAATGTR